MLRKKHLFYLNMSAHFKLTSGILITALSVIEVKTLVFI